MAGEEEHLMQPRPAPAAGAPAEPGVSRRRFLSGGAAATALLLGAPAASLAHDHGHAETPPPPKSAQEQAAFDKAEAAHYERFAEPPVVAGVDGVVDVTLRVVEVPITIRESTQTRTEITRTYNGQVPGPTISAYPGDTINVHFFNDLPKNTDAGCLDPNHHANPNTPHCFNTTNLHTHGLHVSPKVPSDAVLIEIPPLAEDPVRGKLDYCFALPKSHKPGTHWYHAHKHGSTALQLVNGMAGALIVKDLPGTEPMPGIKDLVFLIHETVGNDSSTDVYQCGGGCGVTSAYLVNGQYQPTVDIRPGEIQRWRFINATATPRGITNLTFTTAQTLIAVDGIYLPEPRSESAWPLAPGNRADYLVQFNTVGQTTVSKKQIPFPGCNIPEQVLVKVNVAGPELKMTLPGETPELPRYLQKTLTAANVTPESAADTPDQTIIFNVANQADCAGKFQINGVPFGPDAPVITVPLGATQIWEVQNSSGAPHPFHIHVNPFVVIEKNGVAVPPEQQYFQDTVLIRPQQNGVNGSVKFMTTFDNFDGEFVIHCHILVHEDWGMMRKVVVQGPGVGPCVTIP
ncbi:MAG TPA: hypothetical protein DD490_18280 [Acidobacteria bacterium]|nr:hypothetical protein [Acidobacteriota bacterium]